MRFSIFTPLGHYKFSAVPPLGQRLFDAGADSLGAGAAGAYKIERADAGRTFAWLYAWAMTTASAELLQERAARQWDPAHVTDRIDEHERQRGAIPQGGWGIGERQAQLVRMRRLIQDVSRRGIKYAFLDLLPDAFLAYVPTELADVVNWPTALGGQPMLLAPASLPRRVATLTTPIASVGVSMVVNYSARRPDVDWLLQKGDTVVIEPEHPERAERLVLEDAFDSDGASPYFLRLTPTRAHPAGCIVMRAPWPMWTGSKRHSLIVLRLAKAQDSEVRRLANICMENMARGTSTWDIVGDNGDGLTAGPFIIDESIIGITPMETIDL